MDYRTEMQLDAATIRLRDKTDASAFAIVFEERIEGLVDDLRDKVRDAKGPAFPGFKLEMVTGALDQLTLALSHPEQPTQGPCVLEITGESPLAVARFKKVDGGLVKQSSFALTAWSGGWHWFSVDGWIDADKIIQQVTDELLQVALVEMLGAQREKPRPFHARFRRLDPDYLQVLEKE